MESPHPGDGTGADTTTLPPDDVLVAGLRFGDEAVFGRLLDSWTPAMIHVARAHVSTHDSAAEVVQDTWLAVIEGVHRFQGRSSLRTWVFRILTNLAKTRGMRERRTLPWSSLLPVSEDLPPTVAPERFRGPDDEYPGGWLAFPAPWRTPEGAALDGEVRLLLHRLLADLPDRQRIVVTLRDVEGYTADEVCSMLDLSAGNQRVLLHRGRATVRAGLEGYLSAPDPGPAGVGVP